MSNDWIAVRTHTKCTRCGECCRQLPCGLGRVEDGVCLDLTAEGCTLVKDNGKNRKELLIGYGCGATFIPRAFIGRTVMK